MHITEEEKLMYSVMKAIYESGIPISFKGSMVLKACLMEAGYMEETRHTVDIDANWNSDAEPGSEQMKESLQKAMSQVDENLMVEVIREHGEKRSAGFEIRDVGSGEALFTIDMDVNRSLPPTKIYEIEGMRFRGVSPTQMIADKVYAISTDVVFRRPKDIVDLYYLSKVFRFETAEVIMTLAHSGRCLGDFHGFLYRAEELEHAYCKFRFEGRVSKPAFEEVYGSVKSFIKSILPGEREIPEKAIEKQEKCR